MEKDVTPGKKIIVTMADEVEDLEEVIITGIYSRDKNSYTGSASTYSAKELKMVGAQNIIQSLKTLDPGHASGGKQTVGIGSKSYAQD